MRKQKAHWNEKESSAAQSAVRLAQLYRGETKSKLKRAVFVMYPTHAGLLNLSMGLTCNHIYNGDTLVRFSAVAYKEDYCTVYGINQRESNGNGTISVLPDLRRLENFFAQTTGSNGGKPR